MIDLLHICLWLVLCWVTGVVAYDYTILYGPPPAEFAETCINYHYGIPFVLMVFWAWWNNEQDDHAAEQHERDCRDLDKCDEEREELRRQLEEDKRKLNEARAGPVEQIQRLSAE